MKTILKTNKNVDFIGQNVSNNLQLEKKFILLISLITPQNI